MARNGRARLIKATGSRGLVIGPFPEWSIPLPAARLAVTNPAHSPRAAKPRLGSPTQWRVRLASAVGRRVSLAARHALRFRRMPDCDEPKQPADLMADDESHLTRAGSIEVVREALGPLVPGTQLKVAEDKPAAP
jgi:hypothetical protein